MSELLPCPFCGGEAVLAHNKKEVVCIECEAFGPYCDTEAEAIAVWNTRIQTVFGMTFNEIRQMMKRDAEREQTCELKHASWDDGQCTWGCVCTACDAHFEHETGIGYNYCPNCGVKVVSK